MLTTPKHTPRTMIEGARRRHRRYPLLSVRREKPGRQQPRRHPVRKARHQGAPGQGEAPSPCLRRTSMTMPCLAYSGWVASKTVFNSSAYSFSNSPRTEGMANTKACSASATLSATPSFSYLCGGRGRLPCTLTPRHCLGRYVLVRNQARRQALNLCVLRFAGCLVGWRLTQGLHVRLQRRNGLLGDILWNCRGGSWEGNTGCVRVPLFLCRCARRTYRHAPVPRSPPLQGSQVSRLPC